LYIASVRAPQVTEATALWRSTNLLFFNPR